MQKTSNGSVRTIWKNDRTVRKTDACVSILATCEKENNRARVDFCILSNSSPWSRLGEKIMLA